MHLGVEDILREEARTIHGADLSLQTGADLYHALNTLNSAALCLSGGGIRSAAFGLGVIQALATHPRADGTAVSAPETSLLSQFHYLSTVSGGGYIGSWLSAWIARAGYPTVWRGLVGAFDSSAGPIEWLRSYSNYLTPRIGIVSPDAWAGVALYIYNLILTWLIILP